MKMVTGAQKRINFFKFKYPDKVIVTKACGLEWLGYVVRMAGERTTVYGKANQAGDEQEGLRYGSWTMLNGTEWAPVVREAEGKLKGKGKKKKKEEEKKKKRTKEKKKEKKIERNVCCN